MIAVRLSSPGKALFSQTRMGLNERHFQCLKIRTMYDGRGKPSSRGEGLDEIVPGIVQKLSRDPRVTRVGLILRRTSIDELPQLFNVLVGHMSLVGPRPLMLHMIEPFPEIRRARCVVRPGLTGLWQVRNRPLNTNVIYMVADDAEYIKKFSLWLDLKILMTTPWVVIRGRGAQ
jgi:lipopolysaccharide/colanic/teichoic acid biosynthesis glycosyltransferase